MDRHAPAAPRTRFGWWSAVTTILLLAVFSQAVTAGRMMRGDTWASDLHGMVAGLVLVGVLATGIVAMARLRRAQRGKRLAIALLFLAIGLFVELMLGNASADGDDVLWLHVPVGVAITGFAVRVAMLARQLETS